MARRILLAGWLLAALVALTQQSTAQLGAIKFSGTIPSGQCLNMVAVGDSLTLGFPNLGNDAYAAAIPAALGTTASNQGVGGAGWIKLGNGSSPNLTTRFPTEVYPQLAAQACAGAFKPPTVVLWAGTNDICGGGGQNAAATYAAFLSYWNMLIDAGGISTQALVATPASRGPMGGPCGGPETELNIYAADLVAGAATFGWTMVRIDQDPNIGCTTCSTNLTYFQSDNVHLSSVGYAISTNLICLQMKFVATASCPAY